MMAYAYPSLATFSQGSLHRFIPPSYSANFTSDAGWTKVGTQIDVDNHVTDELAGLLQDGDAGTEKVYQALGLTLSDTLWYARYPQLQTGGAGTSQYNMACLLTADTVPALSENGTGGDCCFMELSQGSSNLYMKMGGLNAGDAIDYTTNITPVRVTQYYMQMERTSATGIRLSVFPNSGYSSHISGSPTTATVVSGMGGLDNIAGYKNFNALAPANTWTGHSATMEVWDGIAPQ